LRVVLVPVIATRVEKKREENVWGDVTSNSSVLIARNGLPGKIGLVVTALRRLSGAEAVACE
jgi:hypothetical protein